MYEGIQCRSVNLQVQGGGVAATAAATAAAVAAVAGWRGGKGRDGKGVGERERAVQDRG